MRPTVLYELRANDANFQSILFYVQVFFVVVSGLTKHPLYIYKYIFFFFLTNDYFKVIP